MAVVVVVAATVVVLVVLVVPRTARACTDSAEVPLSTALKRTLAGRASWRSTSRPVFTRSYTLRLVWRWLCCMLVLRRGC